VTWCRLTGAAVLPTTPAVVATYLATLGKRLSAGALARRAAAIAAQHRQRLASPASDPTVTALLRQARRAATRRRTSGDDSTHRMATACSGDLAACATGLCCC
jgi:hypothetical protein